MADLAQGLVDVSPDELEALKKQEQQAETNRVFGSKEPEGLIDIKPSSFDRGAKLSQEMERQPFIEGGGLTEEQNEALAEYGPAVAGGIVGGIVTGGAGLIPAVAGAFVGGFTGETAKDVYNHIYDPEKAPKDFNERRASQFQAGGEEALAELSGRSILMVGGKVYHVLQPKLKGGMKELREQFSQFGGKFTQFQQTESNLVGQLDSLTRGSMTGRPVMQATDELNDVALNRWRKHLSAEIASNAREQMSDSEFGNLMMNTLQGGKAGFKKYIGDLYGGFDDLVKTQTREVLAAKQLPSSIVDGRGKALLNTQIDTVIEELRPVNAIPLKQAAADLSLRLQKSANLGKSEFGGATIDKLLKLDDALSFSVAQDARSTLLELGRAAKDSGEAKLSGSINKFANEISMAMDDAAKKQGTETFLKYKAIKRQAEEGYSAFNDEFVSRLLNDKVSVEKFSEELFKPGNSEMIPKFRKALNVAAEHDKTINPTEVMDQVKQNYLEDILNKSSKPVEVLPNETVKHYQERTGVPLATELRTFFSEDPKIATMKKLFSPREQQALLDFSSAVERTQEINQAGLSMVMQIGQGGYVMKMATGAEGALRGGASLFLPTKLMATAMTNPTWVKLLTTAAETPVWAKQAPIIATKLAILMNNLKRAEEGRDSLGEDVGNYLKGAGVNFGNATLETLGVDQAFKMLDRQQEE